MQNLLDAMDKYIFSEEKIALFTPRDGNTMQPRLREERSAKGQSPKSRMHVLRPEPQNRSMHNVRNATRVG